VQYLRIMSYTTLDYDPFLCEECSKFGYCIKKSKKFTDLINVDILEDLKNFKIKQVVEELECELF